MKTLWKRLLLCLLTIAILSPVKTEKAEAAEINASAAKSLLVVTGYGVTNQSIMPGMDFTLSITIKNYSNKSSADNVIVMVTNPEGVVPEYGTVSNCYVDKVAAGTETEVSFPYYANTEIKGTELNFTVDIVSDNSSASAQLRIPVGRLNDITVEEYSFPKTLVSGTIGYASALLQNVSDSGVNNVVMVARYNGNDIATANIGAIATGNTKTQYVGLEFDEEGEYPVDLVLTYTDADGENKEFTICSDVIEVTAGQQGTDAAHIQDNTLTQTDHTQQDNSILGVNNIVVMCISGVLLIVLCCVILILIYRRK